MALPDGPLRPDPSVWGGLGIAGLFLSVGWARDCRAIPKSGVDGLGIAGLFLRVGWARDCRAIPEWLNPNPNTCSRGAR